jgi:hypothetical protein
MDQFMKIVSIEPTVFFIRLDDALRQLVKLTLDSTVSVREATVKVHLQDIPDEAICLDNVDVGKKEYEIYLPDIREAVPVEIALWTGENLEDKKTIDWVPQKHWDVNIVHYSHHDLGYTNIPSKIMDEHNEFMDQVLEFCAQTEDWPDESKFRYQCEQAWSVEHYLKNRPQKVIDRLMDFVKKGQIEITALYGNMTTELCGHEEFIRLLYPAFRLKRDYGIDITVAEHNDIPGFSWGLVSILAGVGVKYFCPGVPAWYYGRTAKDKAHPCWDESEVLDIDIPGAFWWEGIQGNRLLVWYDLHGVDWDGYPPTSYTHTMRELPELIDKLNKKDYPYDMVCYTLRSGCRDNSPPTRLYAEIAKEWNSQWAYPRFISTTKGEFLKRFEEKWGDILKTHRGELPNTDYTVGATCRPKPTGVNRNTHDHLTTAEKLATAAEILTDYDYPNSTIEDAYENTFKYDLHCFGMGESGGLTQEISHSEKGGFAFKAAALTHDIITKASNKIADQISYPKEGYYLTLFNPLSWDHTTNVRVPTQPQSSCSRPMHAKQKNQVALAAAMGDATSQAPATEFEGDGPEMTSGYAIGRNLVNLPIELIDGQFELIDVSTGENVDYQIAHLTDPQAAQPWAAEKIAIGHRNPRYLKEIIFIANDVPAMGYKTYKVVPSKKKTNLISQEKTSVNQVENQFYKINIDSSKGAIRSIFDKELGRELVDKDAAHQIGQLISRNCQTGQVETSHIKNISISENGPLYTTIKIKGEMSCCPRWTQEITIYNDIKRIDISTRVLRDSTPLRELFFAFPFKIEKPKFLFEATATVIEPIRDQLPGSNTDYYAIQHWADVYNDQGGVVWASIDAPVAEFGGLWPGYLSQAHHCVEPPGYGHPFLKLGELNKAYIYSMAMYSNFITNFDNVDPGETLYRYSFSSYKGESDSERARCFGWGASNPPVSLWMKGPQEGYLSSKESFFNIDASNVILLTFKKADDENGYILRLMEMKGAQTQARLTLPILNIHHAYETDLVEEKPQELSSDSHSLDVTLKPFAIVTIRIV